MHQLKHELIVLKVDGVKNIAKTSMHLVRLAWLCIMASSIYLAVTFIRTTLHEYSAFFSRVLGASSSI